MLNNYILNLFKCKYLHYSYYYYILTDKNSGSTFSCAFVCKSLPCADVVNVGDVGVDGVLYIINL